jgi:hypothetical protein
VSYGVGGCGCGGAGGNTAAPSAFDPTRRRARVQRDVPCRLLRRLDPALPPPPRAHPRTHHEGLEAELAGGEHALEHLRRHGRRLGRHRRLQQQRVGHDVGQARQGLGRAGGEAGSDEGATSRRSRRQNARACARRAGPGGRTGDPDGVRPWRASMGSLESAGPTPAARWPRSAGWGACRQPARSLRRGRRREGRNAL